MDNLGIVGGAGFVGSTLARHLSKSFKVKVLDVKPVPKDLERKVEYQLCDIRNFDEVGRGLKDYG
jgi:nucleoside-diphosphate-sugar epimerase